MTLRHRHQLLLCSTSPPSPHGSSRSRAHHSTDRAWKRQDDYSPSAPLTTQTPSSSSPSASLSASSSTSSSSTSSTTSAATASTITDTKTVNVKSATIHSNFSLTETQIASMTAGLLSRVLLHPVDCIKTRLQHFRSLAKTTSPSPFDTDPSKALLRFIATERLPGLYRGIFGALFGVIPYSLCYMPSYEFAQAQLSNYIGTRQIFGFRHVLAGSIAGLCGSFVKVPMDVIKKRVQAGLYPNVFSAILSILNESPISPSSFPSSSPSTATSMAASSAALRRFNVGNFYLGWRSSIFYDIPYNSIQFLVLENVKRATKSFRPNRKLSNTDNVFIGALTGMITSIITEPLDVVKTRMMTQQQQQSHRYGLTIYRGWLHCFSTMIKEEGVLSLWKGTLPRLIWVGASSAIWYGAYQAVKQGLSSSNSSSPKRRDIAVSGASGVR